MDKFVSIKPLDSQLEPGKTVIKANEYRQIVHYEELMRNLAQREKERELKSTATLAKSIQSGIQQGKEQVHQQLIEQLLDYSLRMHESLRDVEQSLVEVVIDAVQQIVRNFDDETLVRSTVSRGVEMVRGSKKLTVRVHPQMRDIVVEQLQDWQQHISHIEVLADNQVKLDECVIESDVGIIHASVDLQVESLVRALRKAFPVMQASNGTRAPAPNQQR